MNALKQLLTKYKLIEFLDSVLGLGIESISDLYMIEEMDLKELKDMPAGKRVTSVYTHFKS